MGNQVVGNDNLLYGFDGGINRMFADLESYISPVFLDFQPLLFIFSKIAFIIIPSIALLLTFYLIFIKKHNFLNKFTKNNIIVYVICFALFIGLSLVSMPIFRDIDLNLSGLILPSIAKFFGPYISGIFAILQYIALSVIYGTPVNFYGLLIAIISGILFGMFLYSRRTSYSRCLSAKLVIGAICNLFLNSLIYHVENMAQLAQTMTNTLINVILISPIHALFLYVIFRTVRGIKKRISAYK